MLRKPLLTVLYVLAILLGAASAFAQSPLQTSAHQAMVIDYETGNILLEKNADERMPTSSMSKVLTVYMVFEALKNGGLNLDDTFIVSEKAWRKGGSKMFVEVDKRVKIEDLLRGVIVQSGNDATIVLAEGLAGSEDAFATALNAKAKELGMENSHFVNASGWPDPDHYSTARDLAIMSRALVNNFPKYYPYFAEQEFTYNNITQKNRNPLLYRDIGADGIKTGHTESAGYGLIGSGTYQGRRAILVLNGLEDEKVRAQESAKLLQWALRRFQNRRILKAGQDVTDIPVALGKNKSVTVVLEDDMVITVPRMNTDDFKVTAEFKAPLVAPVKKGSKIGTLLVEIPHMKTIEKPLYAGENIARSGIFARALSKARLFLSGNR